MTEDRYNQPDLGDTERLDGNTARSDKADCGKDENAPAQDINNSGTQESNLKAESGNNSQADVGNSFNAQDNNSQAESVNSFNTQGNNSQANSGNSFNAQENNAQAESVNSFNAQDNNLQNQRPSIDYDSPAQRGFYTQAGTYAQPTHQYGNYAAQNPQYHGCGNYQNANYYPQGAYNAVNPPQPPTPMAEPTAAPTNMGANTSAPTPSGNSGDARATHDVTYGTQTDNPNIAQPSGPAPAQNGTLGGTQNSAQAGAETDGQNAAQAASPTPPPQTAGYTQGNYPYGGTATGGYYSPAYQSQPNTPQAPYSSNSGQFPSAPINPYSAQHPSQTAQPPFDASAKTPKSKRLTAGIIIFLAAAVAVLAVCVGLTAAVSLNSQSSSRDSNNGYSIFSPTSPDNYDNYDNYGYYDSYDQSQEEQDVLDDSDVVDTTDENGPQIELKSQPDNIFTSEAYTAKNAYDKAKESVVGIVAYNDKECTEIASQGTGIIISENGYIITNSHVIDDSRTRYKVEVIIDDAEYDAQVTGFDSRTDIAVLKIDETGLTPAEFADSDELQVGQSVVAIGNPGGVSFSNSITQGIVSALDRDVDHGSATYIQTDAAINPGNSGGPLLNMDGQVVGITTVKIVNTSYEGMGFAIPSKQAASVVDSIIKYGYVEGRVRIGVTGTEITSYYSSYYDMPMGIYVNSIDEDGPLADTDLEVGDIITKIDDVEITSFSTLYKELDKHSPGDVVTLTCKYAVDEYGTQYEEFTIEVTLQEDVSSK